MDNPWQLCRIIGPLLSQRFPLASAKAQPRGGFYSFTSFILILTHPPTPHLNIDGKLICMLLDIQLIVIPNQ